MNKSLCDSNNSKNPPNVSKVKSQKLVLKQNESFRLNHESLLQMQKMLKIVQKGKFQKLHRKMCKTDALYASNYSSVLLFATAYLTTKISYIVRLEKEVHFHFECLHTAVFFVTYV